MDNKLKVKGFKIKIPIFDQEIEFRFTDWDDLDQSDLMDKVQDDAGGYTGQKTDFSCVVIMPYDYTMRLAIHEIVHAASFVLTACGIEYNNDNHEQLAYLIDYIYNEFEKNTKRCTAPPIHVMKNPKGSECPIKKNN